jgi:hypothetical protein
MNTRTFLAGIFGLAMMAGGCVPPDDASVEAELNGANEPPGAHVMGDRGNAKKGGGGSADMTYHGGPVLHANKTMAIFWGSEWSSASFQGDKVTGLDTFFGGLNGSKFAGTSTEYSDGSGHVTTSSTYLGHQLDLSAAPKRAIQVSAAVAEACAVTGNNPDPNAIYFLYTSTGAGHVNYCAWHSHGTCSNGAPVQVAYMPNIDGIAGCDPQDSYGTGHSQGLAAVANVTSHELSEAITDPRGTGWTDSSGAEDGDKCAWTFTGAVTLKNGSTWKLQQEWSNNAYNASQGNPRGCIQGQ